MDFLITIIICAVITYLHIGSHYPSSVPFVVLQKHAVFQRLTSSILTTIGVFGTFFGIFIALWFFDINNIGGSIETLLAGLRVAFWTSVWGMGSGIIFKIWPPATTRTSQAVGAGEIYQALVSLRDYAQKQEEANDNLLTEIKSLRKETRESSGELIEAFQSFSERMSGQIIEAIKRAIEGLENAVNDLLQSRLDELRQSIDNLILWQQTHRKHMTELEGQVENVSKSLMESASFLQEIISSTANIKPSLDELKNVISEFGLMVGGIKAVQHEAKAALSSVNEDLKGAVDKISALPKDVQLALETAVKELASRLGAISEQLAKDYEELAKSVAAINREAANLGQGK